MTAVPAAEPRAARGRAPGGPTWDEVRRPHWQRFRLVVAVGWALVLVAVLLTGVRESSMPSLLAASYDGQVSDVRVSGHGLPAGSRGYEVVEVRWRHGLFNRVTQVVEARPRTAGRDVYLDYEAHPVVTTDAVAYLRDHTDGVRVTRAVGLHSPGSSFGAGTSRAACSRAPSPSSWRPSTSSSTGRAPGAPPAGRGSGSSGSLRRSACRRSCCSPDRCPGCPGRGRARAG